MLYWLIQSDSIKIKGGIKPYFCVLFDSKCIYRVFFSTFFNIHEVKQEVKH